MKIDKIYIISLEANNPEAQAKIIEKIDALQLSYACLLYTSDAADE